MMIDLSFSVNVFLVKPTIDMSKFCESFVCKFLSDFSIVKRFVCYIVLLWCGSFSVLNP